VSPCPGEAYRAGRAGRADSSAGASLPGMFAEQPEARAGAWAVVNALVHRSRSGR